MGIIAYAFGGIGLFLLLDGALRGHHGDAYSAGVVFRHKGAGAGQEEARQGLYRHDGGHMRMHTGSMRADSKYAFAAGVRGMIWRIQSSNHFICWIFSGK